MAAYNTRAAMYREEGKYQDARDLLHHGLNAARVQLGEDSEVTISIMHNYGALLAELDQLDEAASLLNEALDRRIELFGVAHRDTCSTMANLAVTLQKQGALEQALRMRLKLVEARREIGSRDEETMDAIDDLCLLYLKLDMLEEAVPLVVETMEHYVAAFGPGCKGQVPKKAMQAASDLYSKLSDARAEGREPKSGKPEQMGKRLFDVLMAVMGAPAARKATAAPAPHTQSAQVKEMLADPIVAEAVQSLQADPTSYSRLVKENPTLEAALQKLAETVSKDTQIVDSAPSATAEPSMPGCVPATLPLPPPATSGANSEQPSDVSDLLRSVGLPQYVTTFEEEDMELAVMRDALKRQGRAMTEDILKELGVTSMGHRTKIINALSALS